MAELENVGKSFGDRPILDDVSLRVMRGDRVGLLGPNGAGKTTHDQADRRHARAGLGPRASVARTCRWPISISFATNSIPNARIAETVSPGSDWVQIGENRKHISSYLQDFLFDSRRANSPIRMLSGGERNRLLLARLFARPANMLVLDEPTNDLDIDSLELLETMLVGLHRHAAAGEPRSRVSRQRGHPDDRVGRQRALGRIRRRLQRLAAAAFAAARHVRRAARRRSRRRGARTAPPKRKLSFKEQRELDSLPGEIEKLEGEQQALTLRICEPDYHKVGADQMRVDRERASELVKLIAARTERWEVLEALASQRGV